MCSEWQTTTLGEVFDVRDGTHDSPKYQDEGYPLITSKNLKNGSLSFEKVNFISKVDFEKINVRSKVHKGDVLFAMIGTIGNPVLITEEPVFSIKNVALFKVPKTQSGKFLKYYLESSFVTEKMSKEAKGTTQKFVGLGYLRKFPISLPPIPEQRRIVAILDQAFADIEKARANAEKNLKNARELFDSYLNQVFSLSSEGCELERFGDVCHFVRGPFGGSLKKNIFKPDGYAVYEQQHAIYNQFESIRYFIDEEKFSEMARFELRARDLIMSCSGTMGKIAIVPQSIKQGIINQALLKLTPCELLIPEYLRFWMTSRNFQQQIESLSQGAAIKNMASVKILKEIEVPVLKTKEQVRIVSLLEGLLERCKSLEDIYAGKLDSLDELKKSLLQKAFSGELTQTEGIAA